MGDLLALRWRRFGHDRVYVSEADGTNVAWLDVQTGTLTVRDEARRHAVVAVLAHHGHHLPEPRGVSAPAITQRVASAGRIFTARVLGVRGDDEHGADELDGEPMAARLARLPEPWHVLHAIPVEDRGGEIDCLVIGPGGVFTIITRCHTAPSVWVAGETFMVDGREVGHVREARHEAGRASRHLTLAVGRRVKATGVIAVECDPRDLTVRAQPTHVRVEARKRLEHWLLAQPVRLSTTEVDELVRLAHRPDTWQPRHFAWRH